LYEIKYVNSIPWRAYEANGPFDFLGVVHIAFLKLGICLFSFIDIFYFVNEIKKHLNKEKNKITKDSNEINSIKVDSGYSIFIEAGDGGEGETELNNNALINTEENIEKIKEEDSNELNLKDKRTNSLKNVTNLNVNEQNSKVMKKLKKLTLFEKSLTLIPKFIHSSMYFTLLYILFKIWSRNDFKSNMTNITVLYFCCLFAFICLIDDIMILTR